MLKNSTTLFILLTILAFGLAACGGLENTAEDTTTESETSTT